MGWESRKGSSNRYYTRSRRVNGRVVREYIGCGQVAEAIATLDAVERHEREERLRNHREEMAEVVAIDEALGEIAKLSGLLVEGKLLGAGYHRHKGEWRRRRSGRSERQDNKTG